MIRTYLLITNLFHGTVQQRIHNTLSINEENTQGSILGVLGKMGSRTPHVD
jgi:hypothetical protein